MGDTSKVLETLEPVSFQYKPEIDPKGVPQFGLVAEEVEKVAPELVTHDDKGKPYTVRYDAVNAMLLNEFLKEHRKVDKLEETVIQQQQQIQSLASRLQKVNERLETSKLAVAFRADN